MEILGHPYLPTSISLCSIFPEMKISTLSISDQQFPQLIEHIPENGPALSLLSDPNLLKFPGLQVLCWSFVDQSLHLTFSKEVANLWPSRNESWSMWSGGKHVSSQLIH